MDNSSLASVFQQSEAQLRQELSMYSLPKDYAQIQETIKKNIIKLFDGDNEFTKSLNASDAEYLNSALKMVLSFQKLTLTQSLDFQELSQKKVKDVIENPQADKEDIIHHTLTLLPTVICAFISPWLALAVGGGTVFVKKYVKTGKGKKAVYVKEHTVDISHHITQAEINTIVDGIQTACNEIDGIITKIQRDRQDLTAQYEAKLSSLTLEKAYPQVLTSIQYLFADNLKAENKNKHIDNILFTLEGYGYKLLEYNNENSKFFTKRVNPNVSEPTLYLPAIIKEEEGAIAPQVVAEGVIFIPKN